MKNKFQGKLFTGSRGFDPITIIMEIFSLQFCYYVTLALCISVCNLLFGMRGHLGQIFNPSAFDLAANYSFVTILGNVINILFVVIWEALIVQKAIRCLDFTLTLFTIHVICSWIYTGHFQWSFEWWIIQAAIVIPTILICEPVVNHIEQQEIILSFDTTGINKIVEQGKKVIKEVSTKNIKKKPVPSNNGSINNHTA